MVFEQDIFNHYETLPIPIFMTDSSDECFYYNSSFIQLINHLKIKKEEIINILKGCTHKWNYHTFKKEKMIVLNNISNKGDAIHYIFNAEEILNDFSTLNIIDLLYKDIEAILNCIKVGIYITDHEANTLLINKESERTGGLTAKEIIGRNMKDLVSEGYCTESSSLKVLETNTEHSIIQHLGDGNQIVATGSPYVKNGNIDLVITTERDITEVIKLRKLLEEKDKITEKYQSELNYLRTQNAEIGDLVFESNEMRVIVEMALRIAKLDTTVLIQGESGTGKEVLAKLIYINSMRKNGPIIKINCGAIPSNLLESEMFGYEKGAFTGANTEGKIGLFELANDGTLFLDEISEIPFRLQSKLLRAIQEKEIMRVGGKKSIPVNVRIITATNIHLKKAVEEGEFREDLYYRLNVVPIEIPPLRKRKQDIKKLTKYFINHFNQKYKTSKYIQPEAIAVLEQYDWPGNVRELENIIERLIVTNENNYISSNQILNQLYDSNDYYSNINDKTSLSLQEQIERFEKNLIVSMLGQYKNATEISKVLKVNKSTITRKLKKYNLEKHG